VHRGEAFYPARKNCRPFLSQFTEAFRQVKIGDPLDESTTLGPLSRKMRWKR
jgi:acyl-CoA reductase-like NAD-dependent aldehyde dehydrogenase